MKQLGLVLLVACSDYHLKRGDEPVGPGDDTAAPPAETGAPPVDSHDSPPRGDTGQAIDERPCADDPDTRSWPWWGSQPFAEEADPTDSSGRAYYDPDFDMVGWSTVSVPDSGHCPEGYDRAYRATFTVSDLDHKITLAPQSDDGIWLYLNGAFIGHWGGDWQEEGCVNDDADCVETVTVPPVNVTDALVVGENTIAARVSNAIAGHYFELVYDCED